VDSDEDLRKDHEKFQDVLMECEKLRDKKLHNYGLTYASYGFVSILTKLEDKYMRIKRLYLQKSKNNFESIRDSLIDLLNYAAMGIMTLDDEGDKGKKRKRVVHKDSG
jgi:hypothetical protein